TSPRTHGGIRSAASAGTGRPVPESRRRNSRPPGGGKWAGSVARSNVLAPIVQWPRTPPFQGGNTGSNPVGGAVGLDPLGRISVMRVGRGCLHVPVLVSVRCEIVRRLGSRRSGPDWRQPCHTPRRGSGNFRDLPSRPGRPG